MGNSSSNNKKIENTFKNVGNTIKNGVVDTAHKIESGSKQTINTVKTRTLNVVKKVEVGSKQAVNTVKTEVQKPEFIHGVQSATKILTGVISMTPIGKGLVKAITLGTAAGGKSGQASEWMGSTNSTLDMVPGGMLAQSIASVATNGKSDQV